MHRPHHTISCLKQPSQKKKNPELRPVRITATVRFSPTTLDLVPQDLESLTRWRKPARRFCELELVRSTDKHGPAKRDKPPESPPGDIKEGIVLYHSSVQAMGHSSSPVELKRIHRWLEHLNLPTSPSPDTILVRKMKGEGPASGHRLLTLAKQAKNVIREHLGPTEKLLPSCCNSLSGTVNLLRFMTLFCKTIKCSETAFTLEHRISGNLNLYPQAMVAQNGSRISSILLPLKWELLFLCWEYSSVCVSEKDQPRL